MVDTFNSTANSADIENTFNGYSEEKIHRLKVIAIITHITGLLSFLGSSWIVLDVLRDKKKRKRTYHRIVLNMSCADLIASIGYTLSTFPIPYDENRDERLYGFFGNQGTCTTQGFFVQMGGLATALYSAFLATYFLLVVKFGWKDGQSNMFFFEKIVHMFSWTLALSTALASLVLNLFNNANLWCWIAPLPMDCETGSFQGGDVETPCKRGRYAWVYRLAFYFFWLWLSLVVVTYSMTMVFVTVFKQTRRMRKYNKGKISNNGIKGVRRVATQALLYVLAFFITALFPTIVRMLQAKWNCTGDYHELTLLVVIFYPLQGFWNFIIYTRVRIMASLRKNRRESSSLVEVTTKKVMGGMMSYCFCCFLSKRDSTSNGTDDDSFEDENL